jgi:hypothetical protein
MMALVAAPKRTYLSDASAPRRWVLRKPASTYDGSDAISTAMKSMSRLLAEAISAMPSVAPRSRVKNSGPSPSCIEAAPVLNHIRTMPITKTRSMAFHSRAKWSAMRMPLSGWTPPAGCGTPTDSSEISAIRRPTRVTRAQRLLDLREKNGVSRTATMVRISQHSAMKGPRCCQLGM